MLFDVMYVTKCREAQSNLMYYPATACTIMQRRPMISSVFYGVSNVFRWHLMIASMSQVSGD